MGNRSGKFDVPTTEAVNKDEGLVKEDTVKAEETGNDAVKAEETVNGDANGEQTKVETSTPTENTAATTKKKNPMSWLKKFSIRKEKGTKAPKQNGIKEEVVVAPKENGVVEEAKLTEGATEAEVVVANGNGVHCNQENDHSKEAVEVVKEVVAGDCCHENGVETTESPVEEQKADEVN